jgi:hypothetical protein
MKKLSRSEPIKRSRHEDEEEVEGEMLGLAVTLGLVGIDSEVEWEIAPRR